MKDPKEQARDVDVIADGIARFRGMDESDATDRDEARAILAALAEAGLVIAKGMSERDLRYCEQLEAHMGGGGTIDVGNIRDLIMMVRRATAAQAADRPEPEQAG